MPSIDISQYKARKKAPVPQKEKGGLLSVLNSEISFGKKQLADRAKEEFYLELGTLLLSGIDLRTAFELILAEQDKPKEKKVFEQVRNDLVKGSSLSEAMETTGMFSIYEFYSIRIGEETGRMGEVLSDLARYYKNKIRQRRKIIGAVTYPAIVLLTSVGAVFFMIRFVVPMFADVFKRFGGELPWITAFIIRVSGWGETYFLPVFLFLIAAAGLVIWQRNSVWFRRWSSALILKIPVLGNLVKKIYLARFANTMRLLVSTDTPLLKAIALVRQMIGYYPIEESLLKVEQDILKGRSLHHSLAAFPFYPAKLVQLVKVGEEVNRLDYFFEKVAAQYTDEVEYRTNAISSLLEPLIIIFLGLVVGVVLIAMYLPMFQMTNNF